jgi:hypothetical protein
MNLGRWTAEGGCPYMFGGCPYIFRGSPYMSVLA